MEECNVMIQSVLHKMECSLGSVLSFQSSRVADDIHYARYVIVTGCSSSAKTPNVMYIFTMKSSVMSTEIMQWMNVTSLNDDWRTSGRYIYPVHHRSM